MDALSHSLFLPNLDHRSWKSFLLERLPRRRISLPLALWKRKARRASEQQKNERYLHSQRWGCSATVAGQGWGGGDGEAKRIEVGLMASFLGVYEKPGTARLVCLSGPVGKVLFGG